MVLVLFSVILMLNNLSTILSYLMLLELKFLLVLILMSVSYLSYFSEGKMVLVLVMAVMGATIGLTLLVLNSLMKT